MRFRVPTKIIFGSGCSARLRDAVEEEIAFSRLLLVTDKGIADAGILEKINSQLGDVVLFDEVEPNPKSSTVNKAGDLARKLKPDLVMGLGGGSAMDAAKAVALLATNKGVIEDYEGRAKYTVPPLPVLAVPTTCGTGSEVTWVTVVTDTERRFKMSIKGPALFPKIALVDPDLLMTLPPPLVASTGMDALTHAVEAYTAKPATFLTDLFASEALKLIFSSLEEAFDDILNNHTARENQMKGSLMAGIAFGNSDVGAVHCLAEAVGSLYDTPHGVANALFLPYVMEFNLQAAVSRYARIARFAGIEEENDATAAEALIQKVKSLSRHLAIPRAQEIGIEGARFLEIAQKSFQNNSNISNPREAGIADYLQILSRVI